jgi:predicted aspartyl protease
MALAPLRNMESNRRATVSLGALVPAVVLATACQPLVDPQTAVPVGEGEIRFTLAGRGEAAIVVPVYVNDRGPYDFVLDTGATLTCVDRILAEELDLPPVRGVVGVGATVGTSGQVDLLRVDRIAVGDAGATDVTVCAVDLATMRDVGLQAHGLLGLNVLKEYRVTLDFRNQVLSLRDPRTEDVR